MSSSRLVKISALVMRGVLPVLLVAVFFTAPEPAMAQGGGQYCWVLDEKTVCNFKTMQDCNGKAARGGGYCRDNYRLYGNAGVERWCLASKYGIRCVYRGKKQCVMDAAELADQGAACVENYDLTSKQKRLLEQAGDPCQGFECEGGEFDF